MQLAVRYALFCALSTLLPAQELRIGDQQTYDAVISGLPDDTQIWWVAPKNDKWDKFEFIQLGRQQKIMALDYFRAAKFDLKADIYNLMEVPFEEYELRTPGFFIISLAQGHIGFRLRVNRNNSKGFGFVRIIEFEPQDKRIRWDSYDLSKIFSGVTWVAEPSDFIKKL
ncbi:MAG: hypothetical protein RLZZ505_3008 [Verrucomicrobiota bacterium]|jgi:hypothetical protein